MPRESDTQVTRDDRFAKVTQRVWKDVWKIVLPGAVLGVLSMLLGQFAESQHVQFVPQLLHEVGTGFIVACISVFGYEYLRDVSGVVKEQDEFRTQVAMFKQINDRDSRTALRDDVLLLLDHQRLADELVETVKQAVAIYQREKDDAPKRRRGESVLLQSEPCLTLLADLTHDSLSPIAQTLNAFHNDVSHRETSGNGHEYRMPDPRDIAGKVLSMLLNSLDDGDYYKSVANVLFYENTLMQRFILAAEAACEKGVVIKRLFNVSNFEMEQPSAECYRECQAIIRDHLDLRDRIQARHRGRYEIRFYGRALQKKVYVPFNRTSCPHLAVLPLSYFGLFRQKSRDTSLLFFAKEPNRASNVWLAVRDQNDPTDNYFDQMWKAAETAPNPFENDQFDKDWLAT